jgi:hypothetical protein
MPDANPATERNLDFDDARWHLLYRIASFSALITVGLFLFQIVSYFVWPPPSNVAGHFALLQAHRFVGLVSLDFLIIVDEILAIPLFLALYLSLRRVNASLMLLGTALSAASLMCFLIAAPALNMLALSQQYVTVSTGAEREGLLAAGQAVLSSWQGTPFQVGNVVGSIGMMLIGWVMVRSQIFSKTAGYAGIVAGVLGLGMYVPRVGVFISILSVAGMQVWFLMIALGLLRLSKSER